MARTLVAKNRKVAPKKAAKRTATEFVVVGSYKEKQLAWIKKNGVYNYPVREGDEFDDAALRAVKELWLYADVKSTQYAFAVTGYLGKMSKAEFIAKYPTYAKLGKQKSNAYYVFEVTKLDYKPTVNTEIFIARTADFGKRSAKVKKAIEQFKQDGEFAPLAAYLPKDLSQVPPKQLRVSEEAVQMEFFYDPSYVVSGDITTENPTTGVNNVAADTIRYLWDDDLTPLFFCGDSLEVLRQLPENCIDCCMTSPPYWNKRQYLDGGIGLEQTFSDYIDHLLAICSEVYRVLKPTGSFWLNIGDSYYEKNLLNIPSRVAIQMQDVQGWILRNTIIWNKVKGCPDNSLDKLRNIYEPIFHFVKKPTGYFYDIDRIRNRPHATKIVNGAVVSATGVSGIKYKRKIELSTILSQEQKRNALSELAKILEQVKSGNVSDFRMIILGEQRTTHSDSEKVSGRAKELHEKGFYFLKYNPKGSKPSDLWDIIPEDSQGRESHFAPYPEDLCVTPLKLTCPRGGIVLDPFSGTGTTMKVARSMGLKSIGVDISQSYIDDAKKRILNCFTQGSLFEGVI